MNHPGDMETKNFVRMFAGIVITAGFLLGWFVNKWFFLIDAFAGLNLLQSSFTGFCPPSIFHEKVICNKD
jgi:hypothetical protein